MKEISADGAVAISEYFCTVHTRTKCAIRGTFPNILTATWENRAQKDGHVTLQCRWYFY